MSETCRHIGQAIAEGRRALTDEDRKHIAGCDECAQRVALSDAFGALLEPPASAAPAGRWEPLQAQTRAATGGVGRLRTLTRPVRLILLLAVGIAVSLAQLANMRADLHAYPVSRMLPVVLSLAALAGLAWTVGLRPLYRPLPSRSMVWVLGLALTALPVMLAVLPEAHTGHPASVGGTGDALWSSAIACFVYGTVFALPVVVVGLLVDRARSHLAAPLIASVGAATLVANVVLQIHCPLTHPAHLLLGHASIGAVLLLGTTIAIALARRAERAPLPLESER